MNLKLTALAAAIVFVAALSANRTNSGDEGPTQTYTATSDEALNQQAELYTEAAIQAEEPSEERINRITTPRARVNADSVVVRSGPSVESSRITTVSRGTDVWLIGPSGAWYKLRLPNGTVGFIRGDFLNAVAEGSAHASGAQYTVIQGDTSQKIARKIGVSVEALHAANPGVAWTRLQIGQKLNKPTSAERPTHSDSGEKINYISTSQARVNTDGVTIRRGPSTDHDKITTVNRGTTAKVLGREGAWYKLEFPRGTVGYVRGDFVNAATSQPVSSVQSRQGRQPVVASNASNSSANVPASNLRLIAEARKHIGTRYSYGGMTTRGFDCSGFVAYVYRQAEGIGLPRTSIEQSRFGTSISRADLRPGDVVSFRTRGGTRVNHSGIYIGNGQFIHASSAGGSVRIDNLNSGFYQQRFAGARRITSNLTQINPPAPPKPEEKPIDAEPPTVSDDETIE